MSNVIAEISFLSVSVLALSYNLRATAFLSSLETVTSLVTIVLPSSVATTIVNLAVKSAVILSASAAFAPTYHLSLTFPAFTLALSDVTLKILLAGILIIAPFAFLPVIVISLA